MTKRRSSLPRPAPADRGRLNLPAAKLPHYGEGRDFRNSMHWRVFRIMSELVDGFQYIADFKKSVTVFGSTRIGPGEHWYKEARQLGRLLVNQGFAVVTGGGPGIMEGANRGAAEAGGDSIGLNIQLPKEQRINPYVNRALGFHYFFTRKLMLTYSAEAYAYFPGGFGTLDEFFEIVTLIQTRKIATHLPIILVGREYWGPFMDWIDKELYEKYDAIDKRDMKIYTLVDSAEEAMAIIKKRTKTRNEF
jgi:uncharacterized protein (TIGR00730 family)